jgi:hypothetical protein
MAAERHIDYELLAQAAMRGMVRAVLAGVAKTGLPADHHFYIAFDTEAAGVGISPRLKTKYPDEMTIVLQHRFWDLEVDDEQFSVKLTFDGIPERLTVPFAAIKVFFDPSVPYGLQFEESDLIGEAAGQTNSNAADSQRSGAEAKDKGGAGRPPAHGRGAKRTRAPRKPQADTGEKTQDANNKIAAKAAAQPGQSPETDAAPGPKIIHIDAFRKKS